MSSAAFKLVPASSRNVEGAVLNSSVSLADIHIKRTERSSDGLSFLPCTKCQRIRLSAVAQPTHEPVSPWSFTAHHFSRRSTDLGMVLTLVVKLAETASS